MALFILAPSVFAGHTATEEQIACGQTVLVGELVPHCDNGPIMETTSWVVYRARTFVNGVSSEPVAIVKIVSSAAEHYRLSMLEIARQIVSNPVKSNWKGTIVQGWLDRYLGGER